MPTSCNGGDGNTTKDQGAHIQVWQRIPEYGIMDMAIWYYGGPL